MGRNHAAPKVRADMIARAAPRAAAIQGRAGRAHARTRDGIVREVLRPDDLQRLPRRLRLVMQRIGERRVPLLRGEARIPPAHAAMGDERGHASLRERPQIRLAVIAGVGGDQGERPEALVRVIKDLPAGRFAVRRCRAAVMTASSSGDKTEAM